MIESEGRSVGTISRFGGALGRPERLMIVVIVSVIVALVIGQVAAVAARERDDQRRSDLSNLQIALQKFHALNGYYPLTLAQLDLPASACQDPKGHGTCASPDYNYTAFLGGTTPTVGAASDCVAQPTNCARYILYTERMEAVSNPYVVSD